MKVSIGKQMGKPQVNPESTSRQLGNLIQLPSFQPHLVVMFAYVCNMDTRLFLAGARAGLLFNIEVWMG